MKFTANLKLVVWSLHREWEPDRVRRERAGVMVFVGLKHIHNFPRKVTRVQGKLWQIIDEALEPTGRVM
jgi:hypothetical protein